MMPRYPVNKRGIEAMRRDVLATRLRALVVVGQPRRGATPAQRRAWRAEFDQLRRQLDGVRGGTTGGHDNGGLQWSATDAEHLTADGPNMTVAVRPVGRASGRNGYLWSVVHDDGGVIGASVARTLTAAKRAAEKAAATHLAIEAAQNRLDILAQRPAANDGFRPLPRARARG
jgi:hypothetical protein